MKSILCCILLGCLAILASCSSEETIRIGFIGGLSGRSADLGVAGRNGVMLAVEQKNAAGGIDGKQLELVVRDDEQDTVKANKAVAELISQQIEIIIGPMTSSIATAVLPQINASRTILLSPTVTTTDLTGKDDHFLRVIADTRSYADKSARYQYNALNYRTIAAVYDLSNQAYTENWLRDFNDTFEHLGGRIVSVKRFTSGTDPAFMAMVGELLALKPDAVLIIANAVDAAMISQQIRKRSRNTPIVTSEWASTERFIELAGSASEGVHIAQFMDRQSTALRYKKFVAAYKERFGGQEPGFAGMAGYDAALVALAGMEQRGTKSLKDMILHIARFEGTQQLITLDRFGDANRSVYITRIHDGCFTTLE